MWSQNIILNFLYFSGVYCYFPAIYVINGDLLNSRENMIFADNSCGASVNSTTIITTSRPTFITGASSSEVPGARYTGPKTRRDSPESGTHKNEIINYLQCKNYQHQRVEDEKSSNFHIKHFVNRDQDWEI